MKDYRSVPPEIAQNVQIMYDAQKEGTRLDEMNAILEFQEADGIRIVQGGGGRKIFYILNIDHWGSNFDQNKETIISVIPEIVYGRIKEQLKRDGNPDKIKLFIIRPFPIPMGTKDGEQVQVGEVPWKAIAKHIAELP
ncbi:MAG: hypothetical protein ACXADF_14565 [Candidatus Thorarchaeota archaeon]|jgi:hypothetical protein